MNVYKIRTNLLCYERTGALTHYTHPISVTLVTLDCFLFQYMNVCVCVCAAEKKNNKITFDAQRLPCRAMPCRLFDTELWKYMQIFEYRNSTMLRQKKKNYKKIECLSRYMIPNE